MSKLHKLLDGRLFKGNTQRYLQVTYDPWYSRPVSSGGSDCRLSLNKCLTWHISFCLVFVIGVL